MLDEKLQFDMHFNDLMITESYANIFYTILYYIIFYIIY